MPVYRIEWILDDVEASNAAEAAIMALNVQKGDDLPQTTFRVVEHGAENQDPMIVVLNIVNREDADDVGERGPEFEGDEDFFDPEVPPGTTLQ